MILESSDSSIDFSGGQYRKAWPRREALRNQISKAETEESKSFRNFVEVAKHFADREVE